MAQANKNLSLDDEKLREIQSRVAEDKYDFKKCATRLHGRLYIEDVVASIFKTGGHLGDAAKLLGYQRHQIKNYISKSAFLSTVLENEDETLVDDSKRIFASQIREKGSPYAAAFILKTLGKNRGFTTRVEQTGRDGGPVEVSNSNRQDLKDLLNKLNDSEKPKEDPDEKSNPNLESGFIDK